MGKRFIDWFRGYFGVKAWFKSGKEKQVFNKNNIPINNENTKLKKNEFIKLEKNGKD